MEITTASRSSADNRRKPNLGPRRLGASARGPVEARKNAAVHRAFTLLEVILAIAILALALATFGGALRMADRSAERAALEVEGELIADSVFAMLDSGELELAEVAGATWPATAKGVYDLDWTYSIEFRPTPYTELMAVAVTAQTQVDVDRSPLAVTLVRWAPSVDYQAQLDADAEQAAADAQAEAAAAQNASDSSAQSGSTTGGGTGS